MSLFAELKRRNVLRVGAAYIAVAWVLVQVVETLAPAFGFGDAVLRYLVIGLAIALVPVLALSWAFELTREGLKPDGDAAIDSATGTRNARRLDRIMVAALALGLAYFAFDKFFLDPARDAEREAEVAREARGTALTEWYGDKSIAVLPFENMSADPDQEYFSDGISEEILNLLAQMPDLRVISRSSAFAFKGEKLQLPEIAARLNVAHVLEGSVRRSSDRIRITAQLIDARSDTHLWSQTYDREFEDIFAIQDDVARRVVEQLRLKLLGEPPRSRRTDPRVLGLTMQARRLLDQFGDPDATYRLLDEARTLDPNYVPVWTALARMYFRLGYLNVDRGSLVDLRNVSPEAAQRLSREAVDRAIEIDPDNAVAWSYRAFATAMYDRQAAAALYSKALSFGPADVDALRAAGIFASSIGRFDAAIALTRRAIERDPLCRTCWYNLGRAQRNAGRYSDAIESLRTAGTFGADVDYSIAVVRVLAGDPQGALENIGAIDSDSDARRYLLQGHVLAYHSLGREAESAAALSELTAMLDERSPGRDTFTLLELLAQACAWTGRADRAFGYLRRMYPADVEDEFLGSDALFHPLYAALHSDPRWTALTERFGVAPRQLAAIEFVLPEFD